MNQLSLLKKSERYITETISLESYCGMWGGGVFTQFSSNSNESNQQDSIVSFGNHKNANRAIFGLFFIFSAP